MRKEAVKKKIAVLVRARHEEALRMAVGMTLADDEVSVFFIDGQPPQSESAALSLETLQLLRVRIFSCDPGSGFEFIDFRALSQALLDFDTVIPY